MSAYNVEELLCFTWKNAKAAFFLWKRGLAWHMTRKYMKQELSHRAVAVYLYLKNCANKEGTCYPAIGTIARELHLSVSTVKRAISDLEENGFIRKKQRWRDNGGRSSLLFEIIR